MKELIISLFRIDAIKFGSFKLKSGITSPIYIDLRQIVSYPSILKAVADAMWNKIDCLSFDVICGVPYTALPIATAISLQHQVPMLMRRKEVKDYGTKKAIEGAFEAHQRCLIVEDLVTSGMSCLETVDALHDVKLKTQDIIVLLDREQGAEANLNAHNLTLHSVFRMSELLAVLHTHHLIDAPTLKAVQTFLSEQNKVAAHV